MVQTERPRPASPLIPRHVLQLASRTPASCSEPWCPEGTKGTLITLPAAV